METKGSNSNVIMWMTVTLTTSIILWFYMRRYLKWVSKLNMIPGPGGFEFNWQLLHIKKLLQMAQLYRATTTPYIKKFPLLRLWMGPFPVVFLCKAEAAKVLLNSNTQLQKALFYEYFRNWLGNGLVTSKGAQWQNRRKLLTPAFHFKILEDFLLVMNEQAETLVQILDKKCHEMNGNEFDIYPFINRCSMDIICETAMGQGVNAQMKHDSDYAKAVEGLCHILLIRVMKPWLHYDWIFRLSSLGRWERRSLDIAHGFTNKIIKMKREKLVENRQLNGLRKGSELDDVLGKKRRVALLDLLLEKSMEGVDNGGQPLTDEDISEEVDTFIFTGHDTTSATISWTLYYIGLHPDVQQKAMDELNFVYGDCDRPTTSDELHQLKYMECVIKETLRLCPPASLIGRQLTEDMNICGYEVPAGVTVLVSLYSIQRDPAHFPDPDSFDPDRFLPENSKEREPFAYIPFSGGPRNCIGQKFGMMEVKVIVAAILRRFKLTVSEPDLFSDMIRDLIPRPSRGIRVQLEPR